MRGVAAMKEHIIETVAGGLVVLATALLLVYGSKFAWEVVKSDYNDHQELVARETLNKVSLVIGAPTRILFSLEPYQAASFSPTAATN